MIVVAVRSPIITMYMHVCVCSSVCLSVSLSVCLSVFLCVPVLVALVVMSVKKKHAMHQ